MPHNHSAKPETGTIKGVVVAAPASGGGKTTFTLGLIAALRKRGYAVAPFKVGPDFIDPGHHKRIAGAASRNLDGWMLDESQNRRIFGQAVMGADIAVVEGVMGLFDGYDGKTDAGSTAQMAKWLGLPVILVADARSMARSFAALVRGFSVFDPAVRICGVVANNVAGEGHLRYLAQAMEKEDVPLLGGIVRNSAVSIPERHLGLHTAEDHELTEEMAENLANLVEQSIDLKKLIGRLPLIPNRTPERPPVMTADVRIGVARDNAFCFYYKDNLDVLRENGCEIIPFSPILDETPPADIHGLYLGGGYPELFAGRLAANRSMKKAVRALCESGMPVYAECGGFMYLCRSLATAQGDTHEMAGVFDFETRMQERLSALGYREIRFSGDTPIGKAGEIARGHEFHYSELVNPDAPTAARQVYEAADKADRRRRCPGWLIHRTLGSYAHLHFRSRPEIGRFFADQCRKYDAAVKYKNLK